MNRKIVFFLIALSNGLMGVSVSQEKEQSFPDLKGPYFGRQAPQKNAEIFLDGIISILEEPEMNAAFTRDGREFYYCARHKGNWALFATEEKGGRWEKPKPLSFTSDYTDRDFTMSPDGNSLFFGSNRPRQNGQPPLDALDIYVTERLVSGLWSKPKSVGPPVNTSLMENYPSVAANGNLYYFTAREDGIGRCDIYMAEFSEGRYSDPVNLGHAVNSAENDWDSFIAPDESYIIFSSQERVDTLGGHDS